MIHDIKNLRITIRTSPSAFFSPNPQVSGACPAKILFLDFSASDTVDSPSALSQEVLGAVLGHLL